MSESKVSDQSQAKAAALQIIESSPPALVEVRFPKMGTSPDWQLIHDEEELDELLERLAPNVELHVSSVWDLKNPKGAIRLTK